MKNLLLICLFTLVFLVNKTHAGGKISLIEGLSREPEYQGKRLSQWVDDLENPDDRSEKAEKALGQIGTNAIPYLVKQLDFRDSRIKLKLMELAHREVDYRPTLERYERALRAFHYLGAGSEIASIQALAPFLDRKELTYLVAGTMKSLAQASTHSETLDWEVLPLFAKAMTNPDPEIRDGVITAVGECYDNENFRLLVLLIPYLKDPNSSVRWHTVRALGKFRRFPQKVIPALIEGLQDQDAEIRRESATAMKEFGQHEACKQAVPFLVKTLDDPDPKVSIAAFLSLSEIAPEGLLPATIQRLKNPDKNVRLAALLVLVKHAQLMAKEAIPALIESLQDKSAHVRTMSALALMRLGKQPASVQAVPFLVKALQDPDPSVRTMATKALSVIDPKALEKQ